MRVAVFTGRTRAALGKVAGLCRARLILAGVVGFAAPLPLQAQIVLPGAVQPTPAGAPAAPHANRAPKNPSGEGLSKPPSKPAAVRVPPPSADGLAGKTLALNGGRTQISFAPHDKPIEVSRLILVGEMISNSRADCQVEVQAAPIAVTPIGPTQGLERIQIAFPACPIAFDVLDGAALVGPAQPVCEFKAADCRVNPAGLWGPPAADLGPDKDKAIERARTHAEAAVRGNFKALAASTKDRASIMGFAHEQAQFSSSREEACRDYAGEGRHGYCATKLTEARAATLHAELDVALEAKAARLAKKKGARTAKRP